MKLNKGLLVGAVGSHSGLLAAKTSTIVLRNGCTRDCAVKSSETAKL